MEFWKKRGVGRAAFPGLCAAFVAGNALAEPPPPPPPPMLTVKVKHKPSDTTWKEYPVRTVETLPGFSAVNVALDKWGGRADKKGRKATGFFHAEQSGDRWWLVDPDGNLFLDVAVNSVNLGTTPTITASMKTKFGTPEKWATQTPATLRAMGFKGTGSWSDIALLRNASKTPLPYCVMANSGIPGSGNTASGGFAQSFGRRLGITKQGSGHTTYPNDCLPLFHPDFEKACDEYAKPLAAVKDDPYLVGYFTDNEMPVPRLEKYLALEDKDPAMGSSRRAAQEWLDARKSKTSATIADATDDDKTAWTEYAYERYYRITTGAIRRYDPNHLCLGSRLYSSEKRMEGVFRAAGKYLDVIAVNHYGVWSPASEDIARWTRWSGKPVFITEFYAKGIDSGFANASGAGWVVATQKDRGLFYETFTLGLLEAKNCVGWHWFKYMDNDPNDTSPADPSNRGSNKGLLDVHFEPYAPMIERMKTLNENVYALADYFDRAGKAARVSVQHKTNEPARPDLRP